MDSKPIGRAEEKEEGLPGVERSDLVTKDHPSGAANVDFSDCGGKRIYNDDPIPPKRSRRESNERINLPVDETKQLEELKSGGSAELTKSVMPSSQFTDNMVKQIAQDLETDDTAFVSKKFESLPVQQFKKARDLLKMIQDTESSLTMKLDFVRDLLGAMPPVSSGVKPVIYVSTTDGYASDSLRKEYGNRADIRFGQVSAEGALLIKLFVVDFSPEYTGTMRQLNSIRIKTATKIAFAVNQTRHLTDLDAKSVATVLIEKYKMDHLLEEVYGLLKVLLADYPIREEKQAVASPRD